MWVNSDEAVVVRRTILAGREAVFRAWTDADGMRIWMCPGNVASAEVQLDARVGGALRVVMQSGTDAFEHWGEFTIIDPPSKLAFTWHAQATGFQPTLVTVELFEIDRDSCELVLTHARLQRPDIRDQYRGGWGQIVVQLDSYLRRLR